MGTTKPQHDPDVSLVQEIAHGDARALQTLYERHGPKLLNYLSGFLNDGALAEEVLQDVMLAVWNGAGRFRAESKVTTWLLSIARNKAINAHRKRKPPGVALDESLIGEGKQLDAGLEAQDNREMLARAIQQLPDEQRQVLELTFFHGLTGVEAADVLKIAPGTVKSRLHRARRTLRQLMLHEVSNDA